MAPAEELVDLNLWLPSSHRLIGEGLPAPCPEEEEAEERVLGPEVARETAR